MSEHTKTPWSVDKRFKTLVNGASGHSVATTGGYSNNTIDPDELNDMLEANARHIVHCVNNHERLVEALERLSDVVDAGPEYKVSMAKERIAAIEQARALLASLEAEKGGEL